MIELQLPIINGDYIWKLIRSQAGTTLITAIISGGIGIGINHFLLTLGKIERKSLKIIKNQLLKSLKNGIKMLIENPSFMILILINQYF